MPAVRALVPLTTEDGKTLAPDEVANVSDAQAVDWKANGKVSLIADEVASALAAGEGHYTDITGRDEVEPLEPEAVSHGPQSNELPRKKK